MLELRVLGQLDLRGSEGETSLQVLAQPKRAALLAYLAVATPRGFHRRDKLVGLFWPALDSEHARGALRNSLYYLRQSLGEGIVLSRGDEEVGLAEGAIRCDAVQFEELLEQGDPEKALEVYGGDLLEGLFVSEAPEFERWLEGERERLRARAAEAAWSLAENHERAKNGVEAAKWARKAVALTPNDEAEFRRLLELLDRIGNRAGAVQEYEAFARRLKQDYELEPSPETRALIAAIRQRVLLETEVGESSGVAKEPARGVAGADESVDALGAVSATRRSVDIARPKRQPERRPVRGTVAVAVMILTLMAGAVIVPRVRAPDARSPSSTGDAVSSSTVAVFPFSVPTDDEFSDLSEGLMELLSAALDGAGELRRVDPNVVLGRLRGSESGTAVDIETALGLSRELGAGHFVLGRLLDLRGTIRISASVYSLADDSTWHSDQAGELEEILALVNALARDILVHLEPVRGEFRGSVSGVPTTSYTALRAYLRGQALMRRGKSGLARDQFRNAVEEDSMFALAWLRLAEAEEWAPSDRDASLRAWRRAHSLRGRLSPRNQAFLALGYAFGRGDGPAAERAALAMVTAYPDAVEGWRYLGDIQWEYPWQLGRYTATEAEMAYQRALNLDPDNRAALNGLALVAYYDGRKALGDSLWYRAKGYYWLLPEDSVERAKHLARLENAQSRRLVNAVWGLCLKTDSLTDAARIAALVADPARQDNDLAVGHHVAAYVGVNRGRWQAAHEHFAQANRLESGMGVLERAWYSSFPFFEVDAETLRAIRDSLVPWTPPAAYGARTFRYDREWRLPRWIVPHAKHYALGLLSARLGDVDAAARYAALLEQAEEPADSVAQLHDLALEVRALSALERGDWVAALKFLEQLELKAARFVQPGNFPFAKRPLGRFLRAEALMRLGRDQEAFGWYSTLGWRFGESTLLAYVQVRKGEIYERQGNAAEAVRHYQRFIARWREADPEYQPLVIDVRARIARLLIQHS